MTMGTFLFGFLLVSSVTLVHSLVKLKADVIYIPNENTTSALFRCSAGQSHMYYLNHILTWSKIGRDGHEIYLSLNWDLVQEGPGSQYIISSQVYNEESNNSTNTSSLYFVLGKTELTDDDHGDYICRLHDFDRNVIDEYRVPIVIFDKGLALSPVNDHGKNGSDILVNCMHNTSVSNGSHIVLNHVTKDGVSKKIIDGGNIVNASFKKKYEVITKDNGDQILHNIVTIKSPSSKDDGHIVCELRNGTDIITETNASINIAVAKLKVSPLYFLKVPVDAVAHFKCECSSFNMAACIHGDIVWSIVNTTTGVKTTIYKRGQLLDTSGFYDIHVSQNGTTVNLTVQGLKMPFYEVGEYVCSLEDKSSGEEITRALIPVSITPISLGALSLLDDYPTSIRLLCTMTGSMWDKHYFDDHKMTWVYTKDGATKTVASNDVLHTGYNVNKYSVMFDRKRYYSILTIKSVERTDYGDYNCQLSNNYSGTILFNEKLKVYGKGNITIFSSMNKQ